MEEGKTKYSIQEKSILSVLYSAEKPLTIEAIARLVGISRITAKKYLEKLKEKGALESAELGKGTYWWIAVANKQKEVKERKKLVEV